MGLLGEHRFKGSVLDGREHLGQVGPCGSGGRVWVEQARKGWGGIQASGWSVWAGLKSAGLLSARSKSVWRQ